MIEAQLLRDYLVDARIEVIIRGDYLAGAAGELSALQFPELWLLDERDLLLAQQKLKDYFADDAVSSQVPWRCSVCGADVEAQFDLCWNCTSPRQVE